MTRKVSHLSQLTVRGFDPELSQHVRQLARREGISLNKAVLRLLRRGAGLGEGAQTVSLIGDGLDDLIGTWSDQEAAEIAAATSVFEQADEELWR
jgi:hypothetical protein